MIRSVVRLLIVAALVATALALPGTGNTPANTAQAADLSYFDAGNIISDAVFFDALATDAATVQAFLNTKGASCVAGEMPCLKDYRQTTADQTGDAYCSTYRGAANETAATILVKIGAACGINPRVLLVLLQKEQGLVNGTKPAAARYTKATGFACPDSSPCNPAFSGFASQVYFAARQFQRYAAGVAGSYRAGRVNTIAYAPATLEYNNINNARCGTSAVHIVNKATAGLYSYTPYQPNAAALAAGYKSGDDCSAYGNRNFWNYFTDWFGSTQSTGGGAIYTHWQDVGGAGGRLGSPTASFLCGYRNGGCFQPFQGGFVYWSPASGAHAVYGEIAKKWAGLGWENSTLGYPTGDETCGLVGGGCYQDFQGGSVYWTPSTGAQFLRGPIRDLWGSTGWEGGALGYPTSDQHCGLRSSGCFTHFVNGSIYWAPGIGAHLVWLETREKWAKLGWESGELGYPVENPVCGLVQGGCYQVFEGGSLYWTANTGVWATKGQMKGLWGATGYESGPLGYPTSDQQCGLGGGGCMQIYQGGRIFWSGATGTHLVWPQLLDKWWALGRENGPLGYPVQNPVCGLTGGGCYQTYQGGVLYWSPTAGAHQPKGEIGKLWGATGWENGVLGYPTQDEACGLRAGGCYQVYERGYVYWTGSLGAHLVSGDILTTWSTTGYENGPWGYPTGNPMSVAGGVAQRFERGTATWSGTTGAVTFG